MRLALDEAVKGRFTTWPNPMVGAVLVKDGEVVRRAFHHKPGQSHAEVLALKGLSKKDLAGATLYVSLEPCCHLNKRTPPCTNFLINVGLKKLVVAVRDPNPLVAGKGIIQLRKAGVEVKVGVLEKEAKALNVAYNYVMKKRLPFTVVKLGMTLDARIATANGESEWITNEQSRIYVHKLRSFYDAILTSSETVLMDDPHLNVRLVKGRQPLRVIIDRHLKTDPRARVYKDENVIVFTTDNSPAQSRKKFIQKNIELVILPLKTFTLKNVLKRLFEKNIRSVMIEAGGTLVGAFLKEKTVQKVYFFYAPKILGSEAMPGIGELGIKHLKSALTLHDIQWERFGDDFMIEALL